MHSQNNGVSVHSSERLSMEQIDWSSVSSGCDSIGDDGYLKDIPLICGILAAMPFRKPVYVKDFSQSRNTMIITFDRMQYLLYSP